MAGVTDTLHDAEWIIGLIDGAAPARQPAGGHGPADAPLGVGSARPPVAAGKIRSADDRAGRVRRGTSHTAPRRGSARWRGGHQPAAGAASGCGWRGLPGRGGRRAAPSGKSGTPAGGTGNRTHGRRSRTV